MVREENGTVNYFAGIDLLERFFNEWGYTPSILIYCSDVDAGLKNANLRKINKDRIYKITDKVKDAKDFAQQ